MHLYHAKAEQREEVIDAFRKAEVEKIMPVHCTGIDAICQMKQAFGDRCVIGMAGEVYRDL